MISLFVVLRSGKEYKWTFETKNEEDGNWYPAGTMGLMNFKFWQKPIVKYYQNDLIELEGNFILRFTYLKLISLSI